MSTQREFPDLIKAGLKVGDTVNSFMHGKGVVRSVSHGTEYPIYLSFQDTSFSITAKGFRYKSDLLPAITLTPWNPIAGEPFPFPKWEPIVGEMVVCWHEHRNYYVVGRFAGVKDGLFDLQYHIDLFKYCAPIDQAMHIFGFDKPQQL